MTKPKKTWEDPSHTLDADWPPHQSPTIMDLVAGESWIAKGAYHYRVLRERA